MATFSSNTKLNSLTSTLRNRSSSLPPHETLITFSSSPSSHPPLSLSTSSTSRTHFFKSSSFHHTLKTQPPPIPKSSSDDLSPVVTNPKTLKSRLADGEILYGLFLLSFSPTLAEIAGHAGYDYVVVDMEHGHGGISDALPCLQALAATGTPAILRIPESTATWAKKALDLGPQGIMFPMIDNSKLAKKAVSYCKFPPNGVRGSAHTVVRASNYGMNDGYLTNYEDELLIMCQVETEEGVKKIEEIAKVDGVDCIQMGPLDLSASLGYLWDPGHKKVREMVRTAEKRVLETKAGGGGGGAYLGGFAMPHDSPEQLRMRGCHMIAGGVDLGMFRSLVVEDVKRFKSGVMIEGSGGEEGEKDKDDKYWSE